MATRPTHQETPYDLPPHRALLTLDIRQYTRTRDASQANQRAALDTATAAAFADCGMLTEWLRPYGLQDTGDGFILILRAALLPRLIDPLIGRLDTCLRRYDNARPAHEPPLHVRAGVHIGPLTVDHRGEAINTVCRYVASDAAYDAMAVAIDCGAHIALIVSDEAHRLVVRGGRTELLGDQDFWPADARVAEKGFAAPGWLHVPGFVPTRSPSRDAPATPQTQTRTTDGAYAAAASQASGRGTTVHAQRSVVNNIEHLDGPGAVLGFAERGDD